MLTNAPPALATIRIRSARPNVDGRKRVAAHGLGQSALFQLRVDLPELAAHLENVFLVGDHPDVVRFEGLQGPVHCPFEQGFASVEDRLARLEPTVSPPRKIQDGCRHGTDDRRVSLVRDLRERLQIAQAALAFLHIGFDQIAAFALARMPSVAFGEFGLDEILSVAGGDVAPVEQMPVVLRREDLPVELHEVVAGAGGELKLSIKRMAKGRIVTIKN